MSKWYWYLLLFGCLAIQHQAVAQLSWRSGLSKLHKTTVTVVSAVVLSSNMAWAAGKLDIQADTQQWQVGEIVNALNAEEIEKDWRQAERTPRQYGSIFYLLIEYPNHWRVMHIEFIGNAMKGSRRGKPLFIGARLYILSGKDKDGNQKFVFEDATASISLVGRYGLIAEHVEVEEVAYFRDPKLAFHDQTLLTIKDFDYEDYEPIALAPYPVSGTELTMLSYRLTSENRLLTLNYPLERRDCQAIIFHKDDLDIVSSCLLPGSASMYGSPIFDKQEETLVGLFYGMFHMKNDAGDNAAFAYGSPVFPELREYMRQALSVEAQGKLASTWGELKK